MSRMSTPSRPSMASRPYQRSELGIDLKLTPG
jgi:hypothetical protein